HGLGAEIVPGDPDRARARAEDAREAAERRGLPGAVRPDEAQDLAARHAQGDAAHGPGAVVALLEVRDLQRRHGFSFWRRMPKPIPAPRPAMSAPKPTRMGHGDGGSESIVPESTITGNAASGPSAPWSTPPSSSANVGARSASGFPGGRGCFPPVHAISSEV